MKIYGTDLCSKCIKAKEKLKELNIEYEYINFTEDMASFQEFTKLRDERKEFDEVRGTGRVGLPCFVFEDGEVILNLYDALKKYNN